MNNLVINSTSQKRLDILKEHLPQSLLLGGESGVGLLTIARELASKQLVAVLQPQDAKEQIDAISGTITVYMIRPEQGIHHAELSLLMMRTVRVSAPSQRF
jgi:septin family protein